MQSTLAAIALLLLVSNMAVAQDRNDTIVQDFEADSYLPWQATGTAFGQGPAHGTLDGQQEVGGIRGRQLANSYRDRDASTGELTSPPMTLDRNYLVMLIGGGRLPNKQGVELLIDSQVVMQATGRDSETLHWVTWDIRPYQGKQAQIRIFDRSTESWGHVLVDQIMLSDQPRQGSGEWRLDEYRKSPEYMRETFRPQFHFTPELNWMNDPNGLVYFDGEYHLFFQHNPHGNQWGHMSWGHAISRDMVHWQHLPIALHEEYGVMIFSGSCVVDHHNTSGFGKRDQPPLVAIYTGHGVGKQTQDIAYSNDRGRTWTKFDGNPVIDLDEANFRDPKVFWHQPTKQWIMVVSMAAAKYVQFYGSQDLKSWQHLSDFGPAGVKDKPNWECPDLFRLPVEGRPNSFKWVLEVDIGDGAIAGGSGGEYFVGEFDGRRFRCDHDPQQSQWVDHGRDFYAPISFSDIPADDGRRIWIGWMNNWQTNLLPTRPWRSAMSIPRTLALRPTDHGYKLIQKPIKELQTLRNAAQTLTHEPITGDHDLSPKGIAGDRLEIQATIQLGTAKQVGFKVRVGEKEATLVGYDVRQSKLYVDRRNSGHVDFHPDFAGKHEGPLVCPNGILQLHLFVDTSSVEVFGNDGEMVITDRIFPQPGSQGVSMFASGGEATLVKLQAWTLKSVWPKLPK